MSNISAEAEKYIEKMLPIVQTAGALAKGKFQSELKLVDKPHGDVVTEVDYECESIILAGIKDIDATHQIHSEEVGVIPGRSHWSWIVDPLDGTHNFVSGIPLFGIIVTLLYDDNPVAAILHDAYQNDIVHGSQLGGGVFLNGDPLPSICDDIPLKKATIGWSQGYAVQDDPLARSIRDTVERNSKRLLATWSPVIETIKVLTGKFGGIVSYDGEFTDVSAARALVPALGGKVTRFSRGGADRRFIVGNPRYVEELSEKISFLINN